MKNKTILKFGLIGLLLTLYLFSGIVFAQSDFKPNINDLIYKFSTPGVQEPTTTDYIASLPEDQTPGHIIGQIAFYALVVANILAFISFVVAGIMMIISQGNEEELGKAKHIFTYTVLAMILCAGALAIVTGITKLNFFNP